MRIKKKSIGKVGSDESLGKGQKGRERKQEKRRECQEQNSGEMKVA